MPVLLCKPALSGRVLTALSCLLMRTTSFANEANHEGVVVMNLTKLLYSEVRLLMRVLTCSMHIDGGKACRHRESVCMQAAAKIHKKAVGHRN